MTEFLAQLDIPIQIVCFGSLIFGFFAAGITILIGKAIRLIP